MVSSSRRTCCVVHVAVLLAFMAFSAVLFAQQSPWERAALNRARAASRGAAGGTAAGVLRGPR